MEHKEVSVANIRIDFEATRSRIQKTALQVPRAVYIRRNKPIVSHNKAGNINNALLSGLPNALNKSNL